MGALTFSKPTSVRSRAYLEFIRERDCCACGMSPSVFSVTHPHHWRLGTNGGTGKKPDDSFCIPLCPTCHDLVHRVGEQTFAREILRLQDATDVSKIMLIHLGWYLAELAKKRRDVGYPIIREAAETILNI